MQDAVSVIPFLTSNVQGTGHNINQQATIILNTHDTNHSIFQGSFRQIHIDSGLVGKGATRGIRVSSRTQSNTITTQIGAIKGSVIDVSGNVFLCLTEGESESSSTTLGDRFIQIVVQFFLGHDITQSIRNVRITGHETLDFRIVSNTLTFRLLGHQTKTSQLNIFFIVLSRGVLIKQVNILFSMFIVCLTPPSFNPRP